MRALKLFTVVTFIALNPLFSAGVKAFDLELYCHGTINWLGEDKEIISLPWDDIVLITEGHYKGRKLEINSKTYRHEHLAPDGKAVIYTFYLNRFTGEIHILDATPKTMRQYGAWLATKGYCEKVTVENRKF